MVYRGVLERAYMTYFSNKTILVTGATGLIGSQLVNAFMYMGDVRVIVLGRSEKNKRTV